MFESENTISRARETKRENGKESHKDKGIVDILILTISEILQILV